MKQFSLKYPKPLFLLGYSYIIAIVTTVILADMGRLEPLMNSINSIFLGDKLMHFSLVGLLNYIINLLQISRFLDSETEETQEHILKQSKQKLLRTTVLLAIIVGFEEFSQYFLSSRNFDLGDLLADGLGIFLFTWLAWRTIVFYQQSKNSPKKAV